MRKITKYSQIKLVTRYEEICNLILVEFGNKYFDEFDKELTYWVADTIGSVVCIGDFFFNMEDVVFCLKNDISSELLWEWLEYSTTMVSDCCQFEIKPGIPVICEKCGKRCGMTGGRINLQSWVRGLRPNK